MQNDVLKNEIAPWQEKGRWYKARVTEAGIDTDHSDQFMIDYFQISLNSNYVKLNSPNHIIIDYKIVYNYQESTTENFGTFGYRTYSDGCTGIQWSKPTNYNVLDCDVYLFVKEKDV